MIGVNGYMATEKRVEWIDIAKGMGLLFVVLGHTMTTPIRNASTIAFWVYTAIYFFHMPFMFYLSGRTFGMSAERYSKGKNISFIKKKAWQLLVPYMVYGGIVYVIFALANGIPQLNRILEGAGYGKQGIVDWLYGMVIGDNLYSYHLWFIYGLFLMNVFSYFIRRYCKYHKVILLLIAFIGIGARVFVNTSYWGILNLVMKCYLWFVLGSYVDVTKYVKKWWMKIWQFVGIVYLFIYVLDIGDWCTNNGKYVCGFLSVLLHKSVEMDQSLWLISGLLLEVVKWIADVGIIVFFVQIATWLRGKIREIFQNTGRNSYGIYLFHQPFFASGGGLVLYKVLGLPLGIAIILTFGLCYIGPILILKMLNTKACAGIKPFLLGTERKKEK